MHFSHPGTLAAAYRGAQSSSNDPQFRLGALDAAEIRRLCPQFRILVIGKANAGKTTILRKVCKAKADAKPVIRDAEGREVKWDSGNVCLEKLATLVRTNAWGHWQSFSLRKVLGRKKGQPEDVLNPSTKVNQTKTCL
jgi:septin family protein